MKKTDLTKMQVQYLLFLNNNSGKNTITEFSKNFYCSKANAKKIMDRMVILGIFYKELNRYYLTAIGEKYAEAYNKKISNSQIIVENAFKIKDEKNREIAEELIYIEKLNEIIEDLSEKIKEIEKLETKIAGEDILNIYSKFPCETHLTIYKISENNKESFVENSMAMMGFEKNFEIIEDEEAYICIKSKIIEKIHGGYNKKAIAIILYYEDEKGSHKIDGENGIFKIPLKVVKYWNKLGKSSMQTSVNLTIKSQIGFISHVEKANFIFFVNLS